MLMLRRFIQSAPRFHKGFANKLPTNPVSSKVFSAANDATPLISCKIKKFNLNRSDKLSPVAKFGTLDLASNGWMHHKSKGDFFTIHPTPWKADGLPVENNKQKNESGDSHLFSNLGLDERIVRNLVNNLKLSECSYVQYEGIPHILAGDHTLIAAETGCGKTLSYLVPIVQHILHLKERQGERGLNDLNTPIGLVLTPGRELATQIGEVAEKLCDGLDININVLLGGRTKQKMLNPTLEHVDLLIGTMGATSKLVTTGVYRMHQCKHVVLDEADTLLDDSFISKLAHFLKRFPFYKNTLCGETGSQLILASATMPTNTNQLLQTIIDPTTMHEVVSPKLHRILPHLEQHFIRINKSSRPVQLLRLVKQELEKRRPMIVFCNKSSTSDYVSMFLNENGVNCVNLNGDMPAELRIGQFEKFQSGQVDIISTTDMASRGLDTTRSRHIVNYDFPLHMADYIHRIGRTGRLGSHERCLITNFVSSVREIDLVKRIEHTARTLGVLPNVNANITNIIKQRMIRDLNEEANELSGL